MLKLCTHSRNSRLIPAAYILCSPSTSSSVRALSPRWVLIPLPSSIRSIASCFDESRKLFCIVRPADIAASFAWRNAHYTVMIMVVSLTKFCITLSLLVRCQQGCKYCNEHVCMSVCLYACLSVHSHTSKTTYTNFWKFSVYVNSGYSSVLLWR